MDIIPVPTSNDATFVTYERWYFQISRSLCAHLRTLTLTPTSQLYAQSGMHLATISLASVTWDPMRSEPAMQSAQSMQIAVNYTTTRAQGGRSLEEVERAKPGTEGEAQSQRSVLVSVWSTERPQGDLLLATY